MADAPSLPTAIMLAPGSTLAVARDPTDEQLIGLWLNGRGKSTQRAYQRDIGLLLAFVRKPLRVVTLAELQAFALDLERRQLAPRSRHRILSAVKSLFTFGAKLEYLPFNAALPLRLPPCRDGLADRILQEEDVRRLVNATTTPRNRLILQLIYVAGIRVSELVSLTWRDSQAHRGGGQITVFGKGGKTRTVRLEAPMWDALAATRGAAGPEAPVFVSRKGKGHLDESQVLRIVKAAAAAAGLSERVSPHWLRHCHASHALDHGAPIHLVQQTLGHSSVATTSRYLHARPSESSSRFLPSI